MPTLDELGQRVKAKYPGAYDDMPDAEVGRRVQARFPGAYDDFTGTTPPSPAPSPSPANASLPVPNQIDPQLTQEVNTFLDTPATPRTLAATGISAATSVGGAALGALTSPVTGPVGPAVGEALGSLAGRKINVALGLEEPGTLGDVLSVGLPLGMRTIGGAYRYGQRVSQGAAPPAAQEIIDLGAQYNVPVAYADLPGARVAQGAATALEKVPVVGTAGFRAGQQTATKEAAEQVVQQARQRLVSTPYAGLAEAQAAAARGDKAAQYLLDDIANAGNDVARVVQASGSLRGYTTRQTAEGLYDQVQQIAQGLGDVQLKGTMSAIDQAIAAEQASKLPHEPSLRFLNDLQSALQNKTQVVTSPILGPNGQPLSNVVINATDNSYGAIRQLRSDLGQLADDFAARGERQSARALSRIKTAVESDLDTFALQSPNPQLRQAAKAADTYYKQEVVPYFDRTIKKALESDTPDEIYSQFIKAGKGDRAQKFYNILDAKGQAAVRTGIVEEALDKATQPTTGVFSPARFAKSVEDIREATGVFFKGQDKWELDGFVKLLRAVERAGAFAENPPTGLRNFLPALGIGTAATVLTSPGTVAAGAGAAKGLSFLLTSPTGRRLLLAASDATPGSPAMNRIVATVARELTRVSAEQPDEATTPEGPRQ